MDIETYIYGFIYYTYNSDGQEQLNCFYVGRTIDMKRREREHRNLVKNPNAKDAHLLKYVECRSLESKGITWIMQELGKVGVGEYELDSEKAMVIDMTLSGHKLTNMKHGDVTNSKDLSELQDMLTKGLRTTEEVKQYRLAKELITQEKQQAKADKLATKIAEEEEVKRIEAERVALLTAKELERIEQRRLMNERIDANNKLVAERNAIIAKKEQMRKVNEDQRNLELYELRKMQEAEWQRDQEGCQSIEQWLKDLNKD